MNDVDSLSPGLAGVSEALEGAGLGKAQANVYVSFQSHKAFPAHYDTHDVWAVQVEGEKTWNIWEGRADYPLPHPVFRSQGQAHHEQARRAGCASGWCCAPATCSTCRAAGTTTRWPRRPPASTSPTASTRRSAWTW